MTSDRRPQIRIGTHVPATASDEQLLFLRQLGIEHVRVHFPEDRVRLDDFQATRERFARAGLEIFSVVHPLYRAKEIALGLPGRDQKLAQFAEVIRNLGRAGLHTLEYDFFLYAPLPTTGQALSRGAPCREFDLTQAQAAPLAFGREYGEAEMWANYTTLMRALVPVAEEAGVRLALHPDDPPVPTLHGVARIFHNLAGIRHALEVVPSPACGVLLCVGTWAEGGAAMGATVVEAIRHFAAQGKLFSVHFRNVSGPLPRFTETFLDNGCLDMHEVMAALCEVGFDGLLIPDHCPALARGGQDSGLAQAIGYIQGLLHACGQRRIAPRAVAPMLPPDCTAPMEYGARDLSRHLGLMSGAEVPVCKAKSAAEVPGAPNGLIVLTDTPAAGEPVVGGEGFRITTQPGKPWVIRIYGDRKRGAMYGCYALLQDVLGCRWFEAPRGTEFWGIPYESRVQGNTILLTGRSPFSSSSGTPR
jgi:mannonate dehydratase